MIIVNDQKVATMLLKYVALTLLIATKLEARYTTGSCEGRCGDSLDQSEICQCNVHCLRFEDCCDDYVFFCEEGDSDEVTDSELLQLGDQLWMADSQRFAVSDIDLNIDSSRLFTWVNEDKLATPSYALFLSLLDNYNPYNDVEEPALTAQEEAETEQFLDHLVSSNVMKIVEEVLVLAGKVERGGMKNKLRELWFDFYGRSSSMRFSDSSGFEHVFVGEKKSTKVNGFHSWIQMYELEKSGHLDYLGYNGLAEPDLMDIRLEWDGLPKARASMFVGTSPEFDMALYTLCMLARPGQVCKVSIAGNIINLQTYDVSHVPGLQVATAFPMI